MDSLIQKFFIRVQATRSCQWLGAYISRHSSQALAYYWRCCWLWCASKVQIVPRASARRGLRFRGYRWYTALTKKRIVYGCQWSSNLAECPEPASQFFKASSCQPDFIMKYSRQVCFNSNSVWGLIGIFVVQIPAIELNPFVTEIGRWVDCWGHLYWSQIELQ